MILPKPSSPFEMIEPRGSSVTIDTSGKILVMPSGDITKLPNFNECTLSNSRLTVLESPFGGMKSATPDYCPGTLYTPTAGIQITDLNGENGAQAIGAGKLYELSLLAVDTTSHTITEEFQIENTSESNNPLVIDDCSNVTGWSAQRGNVSAITAENGRIKATGTSDSSGYLLIQKTYSVDLNNYSLLSIEFQSNVSGYAYILIGNNTANNNRITDKSCVALSANTNAKIVYPFKAPQSDSGANPNFNQGTTSWNTIGIIRVGVHITANTAVTFYVDNIFADVGKNAYIELQTPDYLADTSLQIQVWDGSAYQVTGYYKLDSSYAVVGSLTSANWKLLDGTKLDDCYGSGNGRALFHKGSVSETKSGSTGSITYSANKGTAKRIGIRVDLPPYDGGRTNFNKIRIKTILYYSGINQTSHKVGSMSYDFADSTNASYGLQNLVKPWIALYDPATTEIDFFLFTHRPKNLSFKRDETGTIHELKLFSGNGLIYHGRITHCNPALDSDSNLIPDFIEASVDCSLTKFLESYGMVS